MELCVFAVDDGYPEAIVRGLRSGFLKHEHYDVLKACTKIENFKAVTTLSPTIPFMRLHYLGS